MPGLVDTLRLADEPAKLPSGWVLQDPLRGFRLLNDAQAVVDEKHSLRRIVDLSIAVDGLELGAYGIGYDAVDVRRRSVILYTDLPANKDYFITGVALVEDRVAADVGA